MISWRAWCGESRTPGSAGGPGKATRSKSRQGAPARPNHLGDAVERAVARHRRCLTAAIPPGSQPPTGTAAQPGSGSRPSSGRIAGRTRQRHAAIHERLAKGQPLSVIAAELGLARNTVRRFARVTDPGELLASDWSSQRPQLLDEHAPYLHQRWNQGCTDTAQLWRDIRGRGYLAATPSSVTTSSASPHHRRASPGARLPKPRKGTSWTMIHPGHLTRGARRQLTAILSACPELAAVQAHVNAFADLMAVAGHSG